MQLCASLLLLLLLLPHCTLPRHTAESAASNAARELQELERQVNAAQQELASAEASLAEARAVEREAETKLDDAKSQLQVRPERHGTVRLLLLLHRSSSTLLWRHCCSIQSSSIPDNDSLPAPPL